MMRKIAYYWKRCKIHLCTIAKKSMFKDFGEKSFLGLHVVSRGEQYVSIGKYCYIGDNSLITAWDTYNTQVFSPQISIGNNSHIGSYSHITAINKIIIGNNVLTGTKVLITDNSHGQFRKEELDIPPTQRPLYSKGPVIIDDNVWIGEKVTICSNVHIGKGAIIAANSVVTHNVPEYSMVAGVPARIIKQLNSQL